MGGSADRALNKIPGVEERGDPRNLLRAINDSEVSYDPPGFQDLGF